jgi:ATP-dependent DNA ligase
MIGSEINKPRSWSGNALIGDWLVTLKIDGVRAIWHDKQGWLSRAGRPLYNIPIWTAGPRDCELYVSTFCDTIRATRTKHRKSNTPVILREHLYGLEPLDPRLHLGKLTDPSRDEILDQLNRARTLGHEGVVLRQGDRWIKVKPEETHDVAITGFRAGQGKHTGRLGFVTTPRGNVGSGFSDEERAALWTEAEAGTLVGQVIEVSCMMSTPAGMFRHPRFVRMRPDKLAPVADARSSRLKQVVGSLAT